MSSLFISDCVAHGKYTKHKDSYIDSCNKCTCNYGRVHCRYWRC